MLTNDHIINKQVFEFSCLHSEHAFYIRDKADKQFQLAVRNSINRVCDQLAVDGECLQIRSLEIDIGRISFNNMEEEFVTSFEKVFFEKLSALSVSSNAGTTVVVSRQESSYNILTSFLLTGSLPWYVADRGENYIRDLFDEVFLNKPESFRSFILLNLHNEKLMERIARQHVFFTSDDIFQLLDIDHSIVYGIENRLNLALRGIILYIDNLEGKLGTYDNVYQDLKDEILRLKKSASLMKLFLEQATVSGIHTSLHAIIFECLVKLISGRIVLPGDEQLMEHIHKMIFQKFDIVTLPITFIQAVQEPDTEKLIVSINEVVKKIKNEPMLSRATGNEKEQTPDIIKFYIPNAGIILIARYLPALFKELSLLEDAVFTGKETQVKAVFILHYLSTGETSAPEYILPLNKILCGLSLDEPIPSALILDEKEKNECIDLLGAVIGHWQKLGGSTVEGLREAFLNRDGILSLENGTWKLQVERKGYDILLDSIPWSFNHIKLNWMETLITTEW